MALKSRSKRTWQVNRYRNAMSALRPFKVSDLGGREIFPNACNWEIYDGW
jgi:hypothetical protein